MQRDAFRLLVERWYDPLYRFARSLARNEDDALDLVQDTFHTYAVKGAGMRDAASAKTWLFSVLHRKFLDRHRRARRFPEEAYVETVDEAPARPSGQALDAAAVLGALGRLDDAYRAPLTLFYLEDLSYKEIAEVLEVPVGTVMSRLSRGKERLRALLEGGAGGVVDFNPETSHG